MGSYACDEDEEADGTMVYHDRSFSRSDAFLTFSSDEGEMGPGGDDASSCGADA